MSDSDSGLVGVFFAIFMLVAFGAWLGANRYQHDTFDCTNKCAAAHSIQFNNLCYCAEGP